MSSTNMQGASPHASTPRLPERLHPPDECGSLLPTTTTETRRPLDTAGAESHPFARELPEPVTLPPPVRRRLILPFVRSNRMRA